MIADVSARATMSAWALTSPRPGQTRARLGGQSRRPPPVSGPSDGRATFCLRVREVAHTAPLPRRDHRWGTAPTARCRRPRPRPTGNSPEQLQPCAYAFVLPCSNLIVTVRCRWGTARKPEPGHTVVNRLMSGRRRPEAAPRRSSLPGAPRTFHVWVQTLGLRSEGTVDGPRSLAGLRVTEWAADLSAPDQRVHAFGCHRRCSWMRWARYQVAPRTHTRTPTVVDRGVPVSDQLPARVRPGLRNRLTTGA
jgi:hypothetical protein